MDKQTYDYMLEKIAKADELKESIDQTARFVKTAEKVLQEGDTISNHLITLVVLDSLGHWSCNVDLAVTQDLLENIVGIVGIRLDELKKEYEKL